MKKTDAWMPLWIGSYLADTQHLSRDEHGGYLLLIMAYWRTGVPLIDDDKRLSSIVKATPKEWKELRPTLAEFFVVANGVWMHKRIEQELSSAVEKQTKAASKAQAAAQARWKNAPSITSSNAPSNATSIPHALHKECPTPTPTPIKTINQSNAGVRDSNLKFAMTPDWRPSDHVADLARQSGTVLLPADLPDMVAHWLTEPNTKRTQAEWDKALLQTAKHRQIRAALPAPPRAGRMPQVENFAEKNYGVGVQDL